MKTNDTPKPDPAANQDTEAASDDATCSLVSVKLQHAEIRALIQLTRKAGDGSRILGIKHEADRLHARCDELRAILKSDLANASPTRATD